ncbi:flagellar hook protein FlgE, partial [Gilvimarinus sp. 1_MG-2023]|nr:flagellar hook protein FlgE [Gilvimarinus sp. 1_MG-2023]
LGSSSTAPGSGVNLLTLRQQIGQGNLNFTENQLDLSVRDAGFFVVSDQGEQLYTRSGAYGHDS